MSQSPLSEDSDFADGRQFLSNQSRLYQLLREGKSFSGQERNCCFLNVGDGHFANVSSTSGFDFIDDARGMALCDWDSDGDQDIWLSNRTAPRIRMLRNNTPQSSKWLGVRLEGKNCNRDAIGAKVEITTRGPAGDHPIVQSVRAGEGFLSQSSKWLHFGLGAESTIHRVVVHWPGGSKEDFVGLAAGQRHLLVQGTGKGKLAITARDTVRLPAMPLPLAPVSSTILASTVLPIPMPAMHYHDWDGRQVSLTARGNKALLLNLWASWCPPCIDKLQHFAANQQTFHEHGIDVVAISVDDNSNLARERLEQSNFPYRSGMATDRLLKTLQLTHDELFGLSTPLPLPTSMLIDSSGQLVAVYKGAVPLEKVLADADELTKPSRLTPYNRFAGQWIRPPKYDLVFLASRLVDEDFLDTAYSYVHTNRIRVGRTGYARVLGRIGSRLIAKQEWAAAESRFREAIKADSGNAELYFGLATSLKAQGQPHEALSNLKTVLKINPEHMMASLDAAELLRLNGRPKLAEKHYAAAAKLDPTNAFIHQNLGVVLMMQRRIEDAKTSFELALRFDADNAEAHRNLGMALAVSHEPAKAIHHLERSLELAPGDAATHNNLGGLLAQNRKLAEAATHFESAVRLEPKRSKYRRNLLKVRNALNKANQP